MNRFLKNCGCVGRGEEEGSHSSRSNNQRQPMIKKKRDADQESNSAFSNADWSDMEEMQAIPNGQIQDQYNPDQFLNLEDYETLEPIDFDYLKQVTGEEEENKSLHSGLSKSSKKIAKNKKAAKTQKGKSKLPPNSPAKGAKARGKRNPWQPHEDARLMELVAKHGQSWSILSTLIEGRTGKQIRDRYMNILRPNTKKGDWTPQEDQQILALYYQYGHKWSKISSFVPGRTEGQVKNRFYAHIKKKILNNNEGESIEAESPDNIQQSKKSTSKVSGSPKTNTEANISPYQASNSKKIIMRPVGSSDTNMNYSPQNHNEFTFVQKSKKVDDPTDVISYEGSPGRNRRTGSDEVFVDPSEPDTNITSPASIKMGKMSSMRDEKQVDDILDKVAFFFERGISARQIPMQEGLMNQVTSMNPYKELEFGESNIDRLEQLQKRRSNLEYLLIQTMQEMNTYNAHVGSK